MSRREFITAAAATATALAAGCSHASSGPEAKTQITPQAAEPSRSLKLLILGGTRFVGPAVVQAALARGHEVTLFNRGITQPWLFPGVEQLRGNRYPEVGAGLSALRGRYWDAVIDMPAYFPRIAEASADLLRDRVAQYVLMSTIGVYSDFTAQSITEASPVRTLTRPYKERPELSEDYEFGTYGARKVLCEQAVAKRFPDRNTVIRACGIGGGGLSDPTKWYWPARLRRDRKLLAPGDGLDPIQWVDRRDVADFIVQSAEKKLIGTFNVVGPRAELRTVLEATRRVVGGTAEIVWAGDNIQVRRKVPGALSRVSAPGFASINASKAIAAGLRQRSFEEIVAADWLWFREHHSLAFDFHAANVGLGTAEEADILAQLAMS